jgi:hypothetical protein
MCAIRTEVGAVQKRNYGFQNIPRQRRQGAEQWLRIQKLKLSLPARMRWSWVPIPVEAWMSVGVYSLCVGSIPHPRSSTDCALD